MSRSTLIRVPLAALLTALVALPAAAFAARPVERFHDNFTDTFSDELCGIPVDGVATGVDNFLLYANDDFRDTSSVRVTFTNPANGKSIVISNAGQVTGKALVDEAAGTVTFVTTFKGLPEKVRTAHGSVLLRDAGIAVFTDVFDLDTGALISSDVSIKGPHPDLESDFVLFCEVVTPALS
jgi:hypothetical protein